MRGSLFGALKVGAHPARALAVPPGNQLCAGHRGPVSGPLGQPEWLSLAAPISIVGPWPMAIDKALVGEPPGPAKNYDRVIRNGNAQ